MRQSIIILILLQCFSAAESTSIERYQADYSMSYEQITLPRDEKMGLVGLGMFFDIGRYGYRGVRLYGAIDGKRGAFFTVGAERGIQYPISDTLWVKSGLFVGAVVADQHHKAAG